MPELQRLSSIEAKSKEVIASPDYDCTIEETDSIVRDLSHIRKCIINGTPLPERFYRVERDTSPDEALETYGLMHLHVGDDRKDLLFVYQYDTVVVFVTLTDHLPFRERPPATAIYAKNKASLAVWSDKYSKEALKKQQLKKGAIAAGILKRPEK